MCIRDRSKLSISCFTASFIEGDRLIYLSLPIKPDTLPTILDTVNAISYSPVCVSPESAGASAGAVSAGAVSAGAVSGVALAAPSGVIAF